MVRRYRYIGGLHDACTYDALYVSCHVITRKGHVSISIRGPTTLSCSYGTTVDIVVSLTLVRRRRASGGAAIRAQFRALNTHHASLRVQPVSDTFRSQLSKRTKGIDPISTTTVFPKSVPAPRVAHEHPEHINVALDGIALRCWLALTLYALARAPRSWVWKNAPHRRGHISAYFARSATYELTIL